MLWGTSFEKVFWHSKKMFFSGHFFVLKNCFFEWFFQKSVLKKNLFWVSKNVQNFFHITFCILLEILSWKKKMSAKLSVFKKQTVMVLPWNKNYIADSPPPLHGMVYFLALRDEIKNQNSCILLFILIEKICHAMYLQSKMKFEKIQNFWFHI